MLVLTSLTVCFPDDIAENQNQNMAFYSTKVVKEVLNKPKLDPLLVHCLGIGSRFTAPVILPTFHLKE